MLENLLVEKNLYLNFKNNGILAIASSEKPEDIDYAASVLGTNLAKLISIFKNKYIVDIEAVKAEIDNLVNIQPTNKSNYNLKMVELPYLITSLVEEAGIKVSEGSGFLANVSGKIPVPTENIRKWFLTSSPDINEDMADMLELTSDDELVKVWEMYLTNISNDNSAIGLLNSKPITKTKELSLLYCAVRTLLEEDISSLTTRNMNKDLNEFREFIIKNIIKAYKGVNDLVSNDVIVYTVDETENGLDVYLVSKPYQKFLEASDVGIDAITGHIDYHSVDKKYFISLSDLSANIDKYVKASAEKIDKDKLLHQATMRSAYTDAYTMSRDAIYDNFVVTYAPGGEPLYTKDQFYVIHREVTSAIIKDMAETDTRAFSKKLFGKLYPRLGRFMELSDKIHATSVSLGVDITSKEIAYQAGLEMITTDLLNELYTKEIPAYQG